MSARKLENRGVLQQSEVTVEARQTQLTLSQESVLIRKSGIEFRSEKAFAPWTEMTVTLQSERDGGRVNCTGVVVACTGNRHAGYRVSVLFSGLSKQSQARLNLMAFSSLG
jgi:hypothetical protein